MKVIRLAAFLHCPGDSKSYRDPPDKSGHSPGDICQMMPKSRQNPLQIVQSGPSSLETDFPDLIGSNARADFTTRQDNAIAYSDRQRGDLVGWRGTT